MTTGKTIAMTRRTFVGKVTSLLLNMLSRLVVTFPPAQSYLRAGVMLFLSFLISPVVFITRLGRDITLPTKVCLVMAMVFPVVMYGCESWTIKKAEH